MENNRNEYFKKYNEGRKLSKKEYQKLYRIRKKVEKLDFCTKTEKPEPIYFDFRYNFIFCQSPIKEENKSWKPKFAMIYDRSEYNDRAVY